MTAYADDLAYIHDVGHGEFARRAAPGLLNILREFAGERGRVVDLGCGSGIWAAELIRAGYPVTGVDLSSAMLAIARRRAPRATFLQASFLNAPLPECIAVTAISEVFNYLFDGRNGPRELVRLFARIHRALLPGGVLVFDVLAPGCVKGDLPIRRFRTGDDWAVLVEIEENKAARRLSRRITSFRKVGRWYRRGEEVHHCRLFEPAELLGRLREIGFRAARVRGYGQLRFSGSHFGVVARKARRG